jgi:pimeloyl-ACP methyl ester carboxylesterase
LLRCFFVLLLVTLVAGCGTNNSTNLTKPGTSGQIQVTADSEIDSSKSIGGITVTVPAGTFLSDTSVRIDCATPTSTPAISNFKSVGSEPEVTITVSAEVNDDIVIDLPSEVLLYGGRTSAVTAIYGFFTKLSDGKWAMISKLPATSAEYLKWGAKVVIDRVAFSTFGKKVTGVIGKLGWAKPERKMDLVQVYTNPDMTNGHDLILVHGWNATRHVFDRLIEAVIASKRYSNIYAYEYSWCDYIESSGGYLGYSIKVLAIKNRRMDIWAHSMGALVSRYALEYCKATKNVRSFVSICGANEGSILGRVENIMSYLRDDYLNKPENARAGLYLPAFDTYSTAQIAANSSFLTQLNSGLPNVQLGNVNYILVAGAAWSDLIVGNASALADHTDLRQMTLGTITKITTIHDHDGLIDTDGGVKELLNYARPIATGQLGLTITPSSRIEASPTDTEWNWTIALNNRGNSELLVKSITFDQYDGSGDWLYLSWYDPSIAADEVFPSAPVEMDFAIAPGDTEELGISLLASCDGSLMISDLSPNLQARTFIINACYQDDHGNNLKVDRHLVLTIPGVGFSAPKTRTRGAYPAIKFSGLHKR